MEMRTKWKKNIFSENSNYIKSLLTINTTWQVAQNNWKTLQTSRRGRNSSIKTFNSEKLLNIKTMHENRETYQRHVGL